MLYLPNEKATAERIASGIYTARVASFGFSAEAVTVFDDTVPERFLGLQPDVIYVSGGNTLLMLEKLRRAGFLEPLRNYVKNGALWIGGSAGAHLCSPDIAHVRAFDGYDTGVTVFDALGLWRGKLVCHMSGERAAVLETLQKQANGAYPVYALFEHDVLWIDGNDIVLYRA